MLRQIPLSSSPDLLVGFDTSDDAGVFLLPGGGALVQTVDLFPPIVDDPYAFGAIAAANSLSDVYAMGGKPITALNIACFDPSTAPAEVWAAIFKGMADKAHEAGAVILGGHSVVDDEPKFGMAVTGLVDPKKMFANTNALPGDRIFLSKPLGTGIVTTAAMRDAATSEELGAAVKTMAALNREAAELAHQVHATCATNITGFGLAGHLFNIARASHLTIELDASKLPLLPGVQRHIEQGHTTGGGRRNREFVGEALAFDPKVPAWLQELVVDPQTSGGLAIFSREEIPGLPEIGRTLAGPASVRVR